ncbi:ABC transporter ATP-binding protein [Shimazuella kribbensis]|uniref:ABC transporter ATP-binding protein n=1 Tax=Shimazuella kribbensis TaxID=139808 RepID=UPI0003F8C697|nr:ABC transporter ATP-binding protein [Shimazuella kribbensis]
MSVIEMKKLSKFYGKHQALKEVSMQVEKGEVYGFIGPNGAGKSTTIRILLGLLRKSSGEVKLFEADPWVDAVNLHQRLAYVPGDVNLWPNLTGGEVIDLLGKLRGNYDLDRRKALIDRFQLDPTKKCRSYSKGNRQKVALISAFASDADLFILDEPTSGLDPLMESIFQECVAEVKKNGKTVLLSSHILEEVEKLCDRVSIIKDGKIIESGSFAEMRHLTRTHISIETFQPISGLDQLDGVYEIKQEGSQTKFIADTDKLDAILRHVTSFGVRNLQSAPPTLEELFMRHYERGVK